MLLCCATDARAGAFCGRGGHPGHKYCFPLGFQALLFILFGFSFWGMVMAIRGQCVELPIIARIAQKITI